MNRLQFILFGVCSFFLATSCFATENLFYILRNNSIDRMTSAQNSLASLKKHYSSINILVPQAYSINQYGVVSGSIDPGILEFANAHKIKLMPLITNVAFDKDIAHQFLSNITAQNNAIQTILDACIKQQYYGVQFDFEMIAVEDRDALTRFYQAAATALHKRGFRVSFAIAPLVSNPPETHFLNKIYVNWEGAYDLKKLGEVGDFVSIMAYNQHGTPTTPGPTASIRWVEAAIQYALQYIPAQKISLGIPDYSSYWFTGTDNGKMLGKVAVNSIGISHEKARYLLQKNKAALRWDSKAKIHYAIYERDWLFEYLFIEDAQSFSAKLALAKKFNLRGISVFDLGTEDARIWDAISLAQKNS